MNMKRNFLNGLLLLSIGLSVFVCINTFSSANNAWGFSGAVMQSPNSQLIAPSGTAYSPQYMASIGAGQQGAAPVVGQAASAISTPLVLLSGYQALYYYIRNILSQTSDPTTIAPYQQLLGAVNAAAAIVFQAYSANNYANMNVAPAATDKNFANYVANYNSLYQNIASTTAYFNGGASVSSAQQAAALNISATVNSIPLLIQNVNAIEGYLYNNSATFTQTSNPTIYALFQKASNDAQYISYYANILANATPTMPAPANAPSANSLYQLYTYLAARMQNIAAQVTAALTSAPAAGS